MAEPPPTNITTNLGALSTRALSPTATNPGALNPVDQPVLNTPYEVTKWHWTLGDDNRAMAPPKQGRRRSLGLLPVPEERGPEQPQQAIEFNPDALNETVNAIRLEVDQWRRNRYEGATKVSKDLLAYWQRSDRSSRLFFAQIEALETLIWLTEVALDASKKAVDTTKAADTTPTIQSPRDRAQAISLLEQVAAASREANDGLERLAIKMATGTGKTVVMGMVIVWHALNAAEATKLPADHPHRARYYTSFLAITPGHTVRERLESLKPSPAAGTKSVYEEMKLVPRKYKSMLNQVQVHILNFQKFQPKDRLSQATGDAKRLLRRGNTSRNPEASSAMLRRVLRGMRFLIGAGMPANRATSNKICVLNDEAHHCYLPKKGVRSGANKDDDKAAALWFSAIKSLDKEGFLGAVYDFSATPMFIETSANKGSKMFPWVVSDFPLMDAIEAGLVKIPRVPVYSDAPSGSVEWRNLYKHVDVKVLKPNLPPKLTTAIKSLYNDYKNKHQAWEKAGLQTPPVFIVVANDIKNADVLYRYLSGTRGEPNSSNFNLFANYDDNGDFVGNLNTLLVHSELEGDDDITSGSSLGKAMSDQFEHLREMSKRSNGTSTNTAASKDGKELVRRALNTVGRVGELGADIHCVVSVSMLTEGWDTRTVTHVLGYRAFGTQLLCEQVTGRALRRTTYDSFDNEGRLKPQFADVLGIPFDFMPTGGDKSPPELPLPKYEVISVLGRADLRVEFPRLVNYLIEQPGVGIKFDPSKVTERFDLTLTGPTSTEMSGVSGVDKTLTAPSPARRQAVIVKLAAEVVDQIQEIFADESRAAESGGDWDPDKMGEGQMLRRRQLFTDAVGAVEQWLDHPKTAIAADQINWLANDEIAARAAQAIFAACVRDFGTNSRATRIGVFDQYEQIASTEDVEFETTLTDHYPLPQRFSGKPFAEPMTKLSELNAAACHSGWEATVAKLIDQHPKTQAWARNYQLDWNIPYKLEGEWRRYEPDFVVRLKSYGTDDGTSASTVVHLLVEVKGVPDDVSNRKAEYVTQWWIPAVRNSAQTPDHLRHWAFVELADKDQFDKHLNDAIVKALAQPTAQPAT